jgi:hypothetical protein
MTPQQERQFNNVRKDRKALAGALKTIYRAKDADAAKAALDGGAR